MFDAIAAVFAGGGVEAATGAAVADVIGGTVAADAILPAITVTASSLAGGAASGLSLAGLGSAAGAAAAGYSALTAQDLYDTGYEFPNPMSDADVANMTKDAGTSIGLQDKGFSWVDGMGWAKAGLGLLGAGANAYGQYRQGQNAAGNANAAANDSRLSAADAARRSAQLEQWGMGQSKVMQPWDENGGRAMAGEQLKALLSDPAGVAANDPAYKLRMQAASRAMGIYGQDSGAMGVAAADASSTWYDQRLAQLSGISGASAAPGAGGQLGYQTLTGAANIAGMGQASGAFGHQAAGAADNARNRATVNTINSAGQLIDSAGRLFSDGSSGAPNSGGGNYTIGPVGNGSSQMPNGGSGSGNYASDSGQALSTYAAPPTINGKPGYQASLGMSQPVGTVGAPQPNTGGPYPVAGSGQPLTLGPNNEPVGPSISGPAGLSPSIGDRTATGHDGNPANTVTPWGTSGNNFGPGGAFGVGTAWQQMQGMGQPSYDYQNNAVGSMSQIGGPPGPQPQRPGPVPNGPIPNAQGNVLSANDSSHAERGNTWQDSLLWSLGGGAGGGGGDLLGDYLNPRRLG